MVVIECCDDGLDKDAVRRMSHEERMVLIKRQNGLGMGLIVSSFGVLFGVGGGLWGSIGPGAAIATGFGAGSGLFLIAIGRIYRGIEIHRIDQEMLEAPLEELVQGDSPA